MQLASVWAQIISDVLSFAVAGVAVTAIIMGQINLRKQHKNSIRPTLRPTDGNERDAVVLPPHVRGDFYPCSLINLGSGGAYSVSAVVFPPAPRNNEPANPARRAVLRIPGIEPQQSREVSLERGTSLTGAVRLTLRRSYLARQLRPNDMRATPHTLYAPADRAPAKPPHFQVTMPTVSRMTITYKDREGAKYGAIFDYISGSGWQLIQYLDDIEKTLDELEEAADIAQFGRETRRELESPNSPANL